MLSINFKANNSIQKPQETNSIGLSENGQKVLNKTNKYANTFDIVNTVVDLDKKK